MMCLIQESRKAMPLSDYLFSNCIRSLPHTASNHTGRLEYLLLFFSSLSQVHTTLHVTIKTSLSLSEKLYSIHFCDIPEANLCESTDKENGERFIYSSSLYLIRLVPGWLSGLGVCLQSRFKPVRFRHLAPSSSTFSFGFSNWNTN